MTGLSFEFFPARDDHSTRRLVQVADTLSRFDPTYFSVTFGAGASAREGTLKTLRALRRVRVPLSCHLCHAGQTVNELNSLTDELARIGVRRVVALRGDAEGSGAFETTDDFVRYLQDRNGFEISVAAYPDVHPKAASPEADLACLLAKERAGAHHALTQFFFDTDDYLRFVERARRADVTIPIVPGLLPIHDIERAISFGKRCGSPVPDWVRARFERADDARTARRVAREIIETQTIELALAGAPGVHIYALNKAELAVAAARAWRSVAGGKHAGLRAVKAAA